MNWTAALLRNEIKKLKAGFQQREQTLLTINPASQDYLDLEQQNKDLATKLTETKLDLTDWQDIAAGLADEVQERDQAIAEQQQKYLDLEKLANATLQQEQRENNKTIQRLRKERDGFHQQVKDLTRTDKNLAKLVQEKQQLIKEKQDFLQKYHFRSAEHLEEFMTNFTNFINHWKLKNFEELISRLLSDREQVRQLTKQVKKLFI